MIKINTQGRYKDNVFTFPSFRMGVGEVVKGEFFFKGSFESCRGYIGDTLAVRKSGSKRICSFPLADDYDHTKGKVYVIMMTDSSLDLVQHNLAWLHKMEEQAGVSKSIIHTTDKKQTVVIEGSSHWKNSAWKIMFYTYLLKCLTRQKPDTGEYWTPNVLRNKDQLLKKVKIKKEIFCKSVYGELLNTNFHHAEGFLEICRGTNPPMFKLLGLK